MRWIVNGADKVTGEQRTMTVEAPSETMAEAIANRQGLAVGSVSEIIGSTMDRPALIPLPAKEVPTYPGLTVSTIACMVIAAVGALVGLGAILFGLDKERYDVVATGAGLILGAGVYLAIGSALDALRDIARNSFR